MSSSRGRKVITREEDVTLDVMIRDKAIYPGDLLFLDLEYERAPGDVVYFREVGYLTGDGWINDNHDNIHPTIDQWVYSMLSKSKKLSVWELNQFTTTRDLWQHIRANGDTLANIRKCYVEWSISNNKPKETESVDTTNKSTNKKSNTKKNKNTKKKSGDNDKSKGKDTKSSHHNGNDSNNKDNGDDDDDDDDDEKSSGTVDLNADTLPALPTPPNTPTKSNPKKNKSKAPTKTPENNKKNNNKRKLQSPSSSSSTATKESPSLDTVKKKARLSIKKGSLSTQSSSSATLPPASIILTNDNINYLPAVILPTGLRHELVNYLKATADKLGGTVVTMFSDDVTHLVTETDPSTNCVTQRTLKYAQGVIAGKCIVSFPWILESARRGSWASEESFIIAGDCFCNDKSKNMMGCRDIFSGKEVFFSDTITQAMAGELGAVVTFGGGVVRDSLPNNHALTMDEIINPSVVVVASPCALTAERGNELYLRSGCRPVSYKWIMDSVSGRKLLNVRDYEIVHSSTGKSDYSSLVY